MQAQDADGETTVSKFLEDAGEQIVQTQASKV
jgi:hypothetical protein